MNNPVTDEEFACQVAEYVASIPISTFVRMEPGLLHGPILAMAQEKGYEDGARFARFFKTPEGQTLYMDTYKAELEARERAERKRVIAEFKAIMGRKPTLAETYELYAEERKLRREDLIHG